MRLDIEPNLWWGAGKFPRWLRLRLCLFCKRLGLALVGKENNRTVHSYVIMRVVAPPCWRFIITSFLRNQEGVQLPKSLVFETSRRALSPEVSVGVRTLILW